MMSSHARLYDVKQKQGLTELPVSPYLISLVRLEGLEPSRAYAHHPLKMAWHLINIYKLKEYSIYQLLYNIYNYIF